MFQRSTAWQVIRAAAAAGAMALFMSGCISADNNSNTTQVTPQGTVDLEKIRAGMPENIFRSARITFAVDTKPEAVKGGKTQYISRTYNAKGGQYMAQCKDERCFLLQVLYPQPVAKEDGLATLAVLVPNDAAAETFVDETVMKNPKTPMASEFHYFGNKALAIVNYADKAGTKISSINVYALPPKQALRVAFHKIPPALKIPAGSEADTEAEAVANTSKPSDQSTH